MSGRAREPASAPAPVAANGETSRLSIIAVISSIVFFCPLTTIAGLILGLWALATVERTPGRRGRRLALMAIALGGMFTVLQATTMYQMLANLRMVGSSPAGAIQQAERGEFTAFRAMFVGGESISEETIHQFLTELQTAHGPIEGSRLPVSTLWSERPEGDVVSYQWELYFPDGRVIAEARLRRSEQTGPSIVLDELRIPVPGGNVLVFPPAGSRP